MPLNQETKPDHLPSLHLPAKIAGYMFIYNNIYMDIELNLMAT